MAFIHLEGSCLCSQQGSSLGFGKATSHKFALSKSLMKFIPALIQPNSCISKYLYVHEMHSFGFKKSHSLSRDMPIENIKVKTVS